ncbi:hypothetical protein ACA910_022034 [Epithemia clementina (nom. ined.)]
MSFFSLPWIRSSLTNRNDNSPELTSPTRPAVWQPQQVEQRDELASEDFVHLSVRREPNTPEGLRGRPSASMLRQELGVQLESRDQHQVLPRTTSAVASASTRPFLVEKKAASNNSVLPPVPSSSWSLPKQTGNEQILYSPAISTNGFYSKLSTSDHGVAVSPALIPGKAKTAVGALVAKQHNKTCGAQNYPPLLAAASSASTGGYEGDADGSAVPHAQSNEDWAYKTHHEADNPNKTVYEDDQPYYQLEKDPIQQSRTPPRNGKLKHYFSPVTLNSSFAEASPSSVAKRALDSSLHVASATSLMGHRYLECSNQWRSHQEDDDYDYYDDGVNASMSSRMHLMHSNKYNEGSEKARYDFGPVYDTSIISSNHVTEVVLAHPSDQTHISAMSLSVPDTNHFSQGDNFLNNDDGTDESLVSQKVKNQRRSREDLVAAAVERLQDDINLVIHVEDVGRAVTQEMGEWFVKTDVEREGILTGFSVANRRILSNKLTAILEEMRGVARPDDFLALSPSEIPIYSETHTDLYQALHFCHSLVLMAIPSSEQQKNTFLQDPKMQGRWKIDASIRRAMNLESTQGTPDAPRRVGGDTSVFTLPSESADTPMTSNLSVSTVHKDWPSKKKLQAESEQIQRTIELVSTLLEKLSRACRLWLDSPTTTELAVKITREIKQSYLQLVGISHDDLCAMVHAFDLEQEKMTALPSIAQLVSADEGDVLDDEEEEEHHAIVPFSYNQGDSFSAAQGLDMESSKSVGYRMEELDDLRRQMGSTDYCENEEVRDGPPDE